jgi:biopolymer transport protein ExbD
MPMEEPVKLKPRVDLFTILGLMLILNIACVVALQAEEVRALPDPVSGEQAEDTIIIRVTETDILLGGRSISRIDEAMATPMQTIDALANELTIAAGVTPTSAEDDRSIGRPVVIIGDRRTPYSLFRRIMNTCDEADYWNISLALNTEPESAKELTVAQVGW